MPRHLSPLLCAALIAGPASAAPRTETPEQRVERVLSATPVIDGHNDLPWEIRESYDSWRRPLDLGADTSRLGHPLQTDLPRLRRGHVGAQFWSVWIPVTATGAAGVQTTLEQIDIVHRMVARYPDRLEMASTAADIRRIEKAGKVASLIGVEGGHQIGNSPAVLRQYYALGVRYMTLSHSANNDFVDSATDDPVHHGLTPFGKAIVREMNRLGMLVDLSHVSAETMRQAIAVSRAPVIFSHSSARAVMDHPRNVPDDVLRLLPANGGVVMVNFFPGFLSADYRARSAARDAEAARLKNVYPGQPERRQAAQDAWDSAHPIPPVPVSLVADHVEHVRRLAGIDHVGIGSDYDGIDGTSPTGMPGVESYPVLFAELARRGWSDSDLAKLAGGNLLRAMEQAERVAASLKGEPPMIDTIEGLDGK
ncbi:MAG: dipeptidase [Alphaproteobacteria bacterium]|nr:dipeptidase [Alphaproteobacteria bacterium]MBV9371780.1 dipeptidase [Alphaproteobacteria bacterium]MBV9901935.1 dipeptidase [Alphaproteobacteria bacterium]